MLPRRPLVLLVLLILAAPAARAGNDTLSARYTIGNITLTGNKVTKPQIIRRELMFTEGDTVSAIRLPMLLQKTKENLLNTSLFNFVTIDTATSGGDSLSIRITFAERWYTWPVPIFDIAERNFNTWWETRDLSRAIYGFYITRDNFRGRKESLTFRMKLGYVVQYGISYQVPYISKKQNAGMGFALTYSRNHEIAYDTYRNKLLYFKDPNKYIRAETAGQVNYSLRKGIYNTHFLQLRYNNCSIADTVQHLTTEYFTGGLTRMEFLSAQYFFRRDYRDSKAYPLKGYYFDALVDKIGLGLLANEELDLLYLQGTVKHYWKLGKRFYPALGLRGRYSVTHNQPYYTQRALGFRDYVRSYEYYVIDGQSYCLGKAGLRFELIKPRVIKLGFLPLEKFNKIPYALYIEAFSDAAYVQDKINFQYNSLANEWLLGAGLGLDLVTYYDGVFRIEYSINRMAEHGFFLHLSAPI